MNLKELYESFPKERLVDECIRANFLIKNLQVYLSQKDFSELYDKSMLEIKKAETKKDYSFTRNFKGD